MTFRPRKRTKVPRPRRVATIIDLDWDDFCTRMRRYARLPRERRNDLLFRGHADAQWPLTSTLDREWEFHDDTQRDNHIRRLLEEFRRELLALAQDERIIPDDDALDLLGRHHGLPSPLLDWTQSPWIAAYFAFQGAKPPTRHVAIWRLDRAQVTRFDEEVDLIDEPNLLRFNRRALMQRSVFLRVNTAIQPLNQLLAPALIMYRIELAERSFAIDDLDEMGINATRLFADVDGAAKTAWSRLRSESDSHGT